MKKEGYHIIAGEALFLGASVALLGVGLMAFGRDVRETVRHNQGCRCALCGKFEESLPVHHRVPQSLGGSDTIENAVGVCSEEHLFLDEMALKHGLVLEKNGKPPVPIRMVSGTLFRHGKNVYGRMKDTFLSIPNKP